MKHIIPTITLTALVAAASAQQAAAPAGLNYNQITLSRSSSDNAMSVQFNPSGSNFVIGFATAHGDNTATNDGQFSAGYVFKGVTQGVDATVSVIQTNSEVTFYSLTLRRAIPEVYQGLELTAGFLSNFRASNDGGDALGDVIFGGIATDESKSARFVEVAYNLNKTFQFAVGLVDQSNDFYNTHTVFSVRAGF
jgi:hypothetical protein